MASLVRWVGRAIGLDVHRDFCVVAICEDGKVRSPGRVPSTPEGLSALAQSLLANDRVALEVTGSCWEVARLLEPHVNRVIAVSPDAQAPGPRPTSWTLAPWRACCGEESLTRCGRLMSAAGSCGAAWRAASSSCGRARAARTRSRRCCSVGWRPGRRSLTCSGSRFASDWLALSCPSRSASRLTRACAMLRSWTQRSPRWIG